MVVNGGNGVGGMEGNMGMQQQQQQANAANRPPGTEYTLQGVMRFLQSEWHRHERERNSWDIEKQEMKARIAQLEGKLKRGDATQNASKKYIKLLQRKIKEQSAQLTGQGKYDPAQDIAEDKEARSAMLQEKLASKEHVEGDAAVPIGKPEDESSRKDLKSFLDQCQNEFTYLMMTPANPLPPRESPPLPSFDEARAEAEGFNMSGVQQQLEQSYAAQPRPAPNQAREISSSRPAPVPNHVPASGAITTSNFQSRNPESQVQPLARSVEQHQQSSIFAGSADWPPPSSGPNRTHDETQSTQNHVNETFRSGEGSGYTSDKKAGGDSDAWDFSDMGTSVAPQQPATNRPDTDVFPSAETMPKSPSRFANSHRRKSSSSRRRSFDNELSLNAGNQQVEAGNFKWRFGLRGHLDTVRSVIFSGGGSPAEPEICTAGDDGMIKRFHVPRLDSIGGHPNPVSDLDVTANFTHRGHAGAVLCLAAWSPSPNFMTGGRAQGDGWIFSGGQDSTIRVWERGRIDPKATLEGHGDAVWALCVLPGTLYSVYGAAKGGSIGNSDRILLVSGSADGTVKLWAISTPPRLGSPQPGPGPRRPPGSSGRVRGNSMSSGSGFANTPQASVASNSPFHHTLLHTITREDGSTASPTCITPLSGTGESFVVSYSDAVILVYDTKTGETIGSLASLETYDGTMSTSVNAVVATTAGLEQQQHNGGLADDEATSGGPTGGKSIAGTGVEGVIISGHEDRFVRFFDANSGQCAYSMLSHPAAISSLSLSPDGRELVTSGHDASLRFWSLEKRSCTQEITTHRIMRGEGVCSVIWSQDGKWVVSGGGDGVVKVFARQ
ncbi:hypothetical protein jhhlp_008052 [Lomentospora prolificans]|uniref:Striatin N-terminal domain-containing protein n=1 Tax=Lomentospora prolificans TaxID=41688 RepID=A0A2N3MZE2_9PEZI|nr:hypothetical protein jhhlp_008052 [Lomentospora prolificans]